VISYDLVYGLVHHIAVLYIYIEREYSTVQYNTRSEGVPPGGRCLSVEDNCPARARGNWWGCLSGEFMLCLKKLKKIHSRAPKRLAARAIFFFLFFPHFYHRLFSLLLYHRGMLYVPHSSVLVGMGRKEGRKGKGR
jgi:hypothetical protein